MPRDATTNLAPLPGGLNGIFAVLSILVFGSCAAPEGPTALTLVTAFTSPELEVLQEELGSLAAARAPVDLRIRGVPQRVLEDTVMAFSPQSGGGRWDLAIVPATWLARLRQRQAILEVPVNHVQRLQEGVSSLALLAVSPQGQTLGYPLSVDVPALYVNPRLFPQIPTSLEAVAKAPLPPNVLPLGLNLRSPDQVSSWLQEARGAEPGTALSRPQETLVRIETTLAAALAFPETLRLWTVSFAENAQAQLFAEGKLAAFVGGPQFANLFEALHAPYRIFPLPPLCEGCEAPQVGARVCAVVINSFCPFPDMAQKIALELSLPERNVRLNLKRNTLPVVGGAEESKVLEQKPGLLGFQRALGSARVTQMDETSERWQQWEQVLTSWIQSRARAKGPTGEGKR